MLLEDISIHAFIQKHQIKTETGALLEFRDHPFLFDIYSDMSPLQCVMKPAQVGMCLSPETRVLTSDYRWVELNQVPVGSSLIGVDEYHGGVGQGRKKRVSIVEDKMEVFEEAFEIIFENGSKIIATAQHRFLARVRGAVHTEWREVSKMKPGDSLRWFCETWGTGGHEDGWMGGILDGEGSIRGRAGSELTVVQVEGAVLDRIKKYFLQGGYRHRAVLRTSKRGLGKKPIWEVTTSNTAEIYKIIGLTRPSRFVNRTDWWEGSCIGRDKNGKSWVKIESITPIGKQRMIDLQTSTKTFIAEGFVSHNSTVQNIKPFWVAKNKKMDIVYTLPSSSDVIDFVNGKTNRIIAQNPILQEMTKDRDTIEQKRVGDSIIYYRGTWTARAAMMIPADLLIMDEVDASKQKTLEDYESRLQHSKYKWKWMFSHPSTEGVGVHKYWVKSDQKHWFIKCEHCNKRQYLNWPESVCIERRAFVCKGCNKILSDDTRRKGEWVYKHKDKKWSGYWISGLMLPWKSAGEIIDLYDTKDPEFFYTKVLGLPYVGEGNKLTREDVMKNVVEGKPPTAGTQVVIGVDTGIKLHYVIGNGYGFFDYGEAGGYDELEDLLKRYPKAVFVFDQGGDLVSPRKFREKHRGRVYLCHYEKDRKTMELIRWGKDKEEGNVKVDRNRMISLIVGEFQDGRLPLYGTESKWEGLWQHAAAIYRLKKENEALGTMEYKWERSGEDHWLHALLYCRVGLSRFTEPGGTIIRGKQSKKNDGIQEGITLRPDGSFDNNPLKRTNFIL